VNGERALRAAVGIVGAGPAGLMLSHLLARAGISSIIVENRTRAEIEATIRAGVLEQGTVDLMAETGLGARLLSEGFVHHGISFRFENRFHRIDFSALTGGKAITVYPQHEVLKDLIKSRLDAGGTIFFSADRASLHDLDSDTPSLRFVSDNHAHRLVCDFIAGCDGGTGPARHAIPDTAHRIFERHYPFGWFGILAAAPPSSPELIYARHERGFALISTRSPTVQRLYFQCDPDTSPDDWSDDRIWAELHTRVSGPDFRLHEGKIFQKGVIHMHSRVAEPMQYRRLFLAGDAAHIVPPTGAKGLNLAIADAFLLSRALAAFYGTGRHDLLDTYSTTALHRVWRAQHFSWWMTAMLHRFNDASSFDRRRQLAELEMVATSHAAQTLLAENYVGLPLEERPRGLCPLGTPARAWGPGPHSFGRR